MGYEDKLRKQILAEELAQRAEQKPIDVLQEALPYQLDFIRDPALWKVICSERRAGKTSALVLALLDTCLRIPGAHCSYFSLSNETCLRIVKPVLMPFLVKYKIKAKFTSKYVIKFDSGSTIYLLGLNSSKEDMHKARGQASDLTVIDECQDFDQDLRQIVQDVLKMTLVQRNSPLIMAGTPGNKQGTHYWFQINKKDSTETEFKRFKFHWKDNTKIDEKSGLRICDAIQAMVDKELAENPEKIKDPSFRQEVLGEWVTETSARIYRYEPLVNDITELPSAAFLRTATFALGFDLGFHPAPTALVIGCWNTTYDGYIYILKAEEHHKMITQNLTLRIRELDNQYKFSYIVGDSANLNVVEDMRQTYGIPCIRADKLGKLAHQNMINSDFITNHIRLYKPETQLLSKQLQEVIWDSKGLLLGKHVEDGKYDNHCTDSLLYLHHFSRHHWYQAPSPKTTLLTMTGPQYNEKLAEQLIERNRHNDYEIDWLDPNASNRNSPWHDF